MYKTGTIALITIALVYANSIDDKIEKLKKTPAKERFELMNSIKKDIALMHQKERLKAIKKLQKSLDNNRSLKEFSSKDTKIKIENQSEDGLSNMIENFKSHLGESHHDKR